jgi:hypothetical protein
VARFEISVPVDILVLTSEDIEAYRGKVGMVIGPGLAEGSACRRCAGPVSGRAFDGAALLLLEMWRRAREHGA